MTEQPQLVNRLNRGKKKHYQLKDPAVSQTINKVANKRSPRRYAPRNISSER